MNHSDMRNCSNRSHEMHHEHHHYHHHHHHLDATEPQADMKMYFHTGFVETILFELWTTRSVPIFICSWIFIFILGVLYEGIREVRQYLEDIPATQRPIVSKAADESELERINIESTESTPRIKTKPIRRLTRPVIDSLLYTAQLLLGFSLMLIAMTFNVYLFLAIILGIGAGHLLYTFCRIIPVTTNNNTRQI